MGKVIHQKLCKKYELDHTNKWYMHYPESTLENETDFEIQTDHLISARRPDLVIVNKKRTYQIVDLAIPADHRIRL